MPKKEEIFDGVHLIHKRLFWSTIGKEKIEQELLRSNQNDSSDSVKKRQTSGGKISVQTLNKRLKSGSNLTAEIGRDENIFGKNGPRTTFANLLKNKQNINGPIAPAGQPWRLDNNTEKVQDSNYNSIFTPSIAPFKRSNSQNEIVTSPSIATLLNTYPFEAVSIEDDFPKRASLENDAQYDTFTATYPVKFSGESGEDALVWVPIPSVAPNQHLVAMSVVPRSAKLEFRRDNAGNYYVGTQYRGVVRLNLQLMVERFYFNGELSSDLTWNEIDEAAMKSGIAVRLNDPNFETEILHILQKLKADRSVSPSVALKRLVKFFREFTAKEKDVAVDITKESASKVFAKMMAEKAGVCRHRAILFLAATTALGLPAHFVNNEAHAFVEVFWPQHGKSKLQSRFGQWRRIDLGGAAEHLDLSNIAGKSLHSRKDNTFAEPASFQSAAVPFPNDVERASVGTSSTTVAGSGEDVTDMRVRGVDLSHFPKDVGQIDASSMPLREVESVARPNTKSKVARDRRLATTMQVIDSARKIRRGKSLTISARLESLGKPLTRKRVRIYLSTIGDERASDALELGSDVTNALGEVYISVTIPAQLHTGRWSIFAAFAGDERYRGSVSE